MNQFCDYMIQNGAITEEVLLNSLLDQMDTTPSLAELIYDQKLIPVRSQLEVFKHSLSEGKTYQDSLAELKYWTKNIEESIRDQARNNPSIYYHLIESSHIESIDIIKCLDNFVAEFDPGRLESKKISQVESNHSEVDEYTPSYEFSFSPLDNKISKKITELLNKEFKLAFLNDLESIGRSANPEILRSIEQMISNITDFCQENGLDLGFRISRSILSTTQVILEDWIQNRNDLTPWIEIVKLYINELFLLKVFVEVSKSEQTYWNVQERQIKYKALIEKCLNLRGTLA